MFVYDVFNKRNIRIKDLVKVISSIVINILKKKTNKTCVYIKVKNTKIKLVE